MEPTEQFEKLVADARLAYHKSLTDGPAEDAIPAVVEFVLRRAGRVGPLEVGDVLCGHCDGEFGRDSYGDKIVEAIGPDWVVARECDRPVFAGDRWPIRSGSLVKFRTS